MLEHITRALYYLNIHLLYASAVWLAAWVLTSIPIRNTSATTRYWIWVATSLNFILPVGAALDWMGASRITWAHPLGIIGAPVYSLSHSSAAPWLALAWALGATLMLWKLCLRLRAEHRDARAIERDNAEMRQNTLTDGVLVRFGKCSQGPAVNGVLRPHISLPTGIDSLLSEQELNAVLIHELTHAKRRDNLIRLLHEVGLSLIWFHPLMWITGRRLALYRELSCDESVIQCARGPELISALAKLANPEEPFLLQATASSFLSHRLARLAAARSGQTGRTSSSLLAVAFAIVLFAGFFETIAHTACCFALKQ